MYIGLYVKYPLFLYGFNEIWIFLQDFLKILKSHFMKSRLLGAEFFHANRRTDGEIDGLTDMAKLIVNFCSFVSAP
jgi:hypothetical protein